MYWVNGKQQNNIDVGDRAVQFGDGCFTTMYVKQCRPIMLDKHLDRLQRDSAALYLPNIDWQWLAHHISEIASKAQTDDAVIKIIISRGVGGRGYSSKGITNATVIASLSAYPMHYHAQRQHGIAVGISPLHLGQNSSLAGIKHLNRLEQILIKHHIETTAFDDVLVCDYEGYLIEANAANLFWRKNTTIFTPDLTASGVNGIMRQAVLQWITQAGLDIQVVKEKPETLCDADEIWLTNALMPIIPITQLTFSEDKTYQFLNRSYYDAVLQHCLSPK